MSSTTIPRTPRLFVLPRMVGYLSGQILCVTSVEGYHCLRRGRVELGRCERGPEINQAVIHIVLLQRALSYIQIVPPTAEIDRGIKSIWRNQVMDIPRE